MDTIRQFRSKLPDAAFGGVEEIAQMLFTAPILVVIIGNLIAKAVVVELGLHCRDSENLEVFE